MVKKNLALLINMVLVPITVWGGYSFLNDKKYYFISFLLIFEALLSLMILFENRKTRLSEMITISVLSAICAISRAMFYAVPEIKPMLSVVIIAGIVFGKESAVMVGMLRKFCF